MTDFFKYLNYENDRLFNSFNITNIDTFKAFSSNNKMDIEVYNSQNRDTRATNSKIKFSTIIKPLAWLKCSASLDSQKKLGVNFQHSFRSLQNSMVMIESDHNHQWLSNRTTTSKNEISFVPCSWFQSQITLNNIHYHNPSKNDRMLSFNFALGVPWLKAIKATESLNVDYDLTKNKLLNLEYADKTQQGSSQIILSQKLKMNDEKKLQAGQSKMSFQTKNKDDSEFGVITTVDDYKLNIENCIKKKINNSLELFGKTVDLSHELIIKFDGNGKSQLQVSKEMGDLTLSMCSNVNLMKIGEINPKSFTFGLVQS